ncbi:hypothetical protein L6164_023314 [Bauhinia variegata]|uniref:Uncharacterized protein n=1 Tax=Bauhinia variegata TaxID=167791 RepID=A0ACB9ML67_BAUVA|nr:hypothetical protein L6164_023314 [Bauhinia variegata]
MAGGFTITGQSRGYNGKITVFVILSCMMAGMGGVIFGYDIGISGGVTSMEPFLKRFFPNVYHKMKEDTDTSNYCLFDSQLLTSFTSSLYVSGLIASFFASYVTANYGRKPSIIIGGAAFLAGSVVGGVAVNIYMLIIGRLLLGVGIGFANQAVPLYLSEMAPTRTIRAYCSSADQEKGDSMPCDHWVFEKRKRISLKEHADFIIGLLGISALSFPLEMLANSWICASRWMTTCVSPSGFCLAVAESIESYMKEDLWGKCHEPSSSVAKVEVQSKRIQPKVEICGRRQEYLELSFGVALWA